MENLSRRNFLQMAGNGLLAVCGLLGIGTILRFLGYVETPAQPTEYDLGPASDYPLGSSTHLPEIPALLVHRENGFTAINLTCTHLGCSVLPKADQLVCPCHGSVYDQDGGVVKGPSSARLNTFQVVINDSGNLILRKTV